MIVLFVKFETTLSEEEVRTVALERIEQFRALPALVQKYYVKLDKPNHYAGIYVWESPEAMAEYREGELSKSIAAAYKVVGKPEVGIYPVLFPLRD